MLNDGPASGAGDSAGVAECERDEDAWPTVHERQVVCGRTGPTHLGLSLFLALLLCALRCLLLLFLLPCLLLLELLELAAAHVFCRARAGVGLERLALLGYLRLQGLHVVVVVENKNKGQKRV